MPASTYRILFLVLTLFASSSFSESLLRRHNGRPLQAESELEALESWETPIPFFFIRSHHEVPVVDPETFEVKIDGLVEHPLKLSLKDLQSFPEKSLHAVLECSGNGRGLQDPRVPGVQWLRGAAGNAEWTGASLADILKKAGVKPEAKFLRIEGADKTALPAVPPFIRSIPLAKATDSQTLLAWKMNRERLPLLHGGPVRLVLPGWYGQNWIKWVMHLTLEAQEDPGFYMKKGYRMPKTPVKPGQPWDSATGNPVQELRVQTIIVSPQPNQLVNAGPLEVRGKAFSSVPVAKVEASIDGGKHWKEAKLEAVHPTGGWQEFQFSTAAKGSKFTVMTRATDTLGNVQPMTAQWNPPGYLYNAVERVTVRVGKSVPNLSSGREILQSKCYTCHSGEMIDGQRLSKEAWEKTLDKMVKFGATLTAEERPALLALLTQTSAKEPLAQDPRTDYAVETTLVSPEPREASDSRGAKLFATHCASCHGKSGEGLTGPRLLGRVVTWGSFRQAIWEGRGAMPSFKESISDAAIADLRHYLAAPLAD